MSAVGKQKGRKAKAKLIRKDVQALEERLKKEAERIVKPVPIFYAIFR